MNRFPNFVPILLMSGGIASDAYDLFAINIVITILENIYNTKPWNMSLLSDACLLGTVIGQLGGGFLADRFGRKRMSIFSASILIIGAIGSSVLSYGFGNSWYCLLSFLIVWRLVLGVGIGMEYPISATFSGERVSEDKYRGTKTTAMFSSQGVGNLLAAVISFLCLFIPNLNVVWRLILFVGAIPACIMIYPRTKLTENKTYNESKNFENERHHSILTILSKYWKELLATAGSWFIFDIVFYANGLFSGTLIEMTGLSSQPGYTTQETLQNTALFNIMIASIALPGYWFAVGTIDFIGRRWLQIGGFIMMGVLYITIGIFYNSLINISWLFIILYGLSYFSANAGPNSTTFILAMENYPTVIRSTCHGISAACGKIGALLGGMAMDPIMNSIGVNNTLIICGAISLFGALWSFFLVQETKNISLSNRDTLWLTNDINKRRISLNDYDDNVNFNNYQSV